VIALLKHIYLTPWFLVYAAGAWLMFVKLDRPVWQLLLLSVAWCAVVDFVAGQWRAYRRGVRAGRAAARQVPRR
jgi:hypothetical protein